MSPLHRLAVPKRYNSAFSSSLKTSFLEPGLNTMHENSAFYRKLFALEPWLIKDIYLKPIYYCSHIFTGSKPLFNTFHNSLTIWLSYFCFLIFTPWQNRIAHFKMYGTLSLAYSAPLWVSPFIISKHSVIKCDHCILSQCTFSLTSVSGRL